MSQLPLPITPADALEHIITPALALLPPAMTSNEAGVLTLAIELQESGGARRAQMGGGPARGLWQCERAGAVMEVLSNAATARYTNALCAVRGVPATSYGLYVALEHDDILAAGVARLRLWCDPAPLPALGDRDGAFAYYHRTWRPGAYDRGNADQRADILKRWATSYALALKAVTQPVLH